MDIKQCKDYWEGVSKENPLYFILSNSDSQTEEKFFGTGECDYALITGDICLGKDMDVLEIGCGVGRLVFAFGKHVRSAAGLDISAEYIRLANEYKIRFKANNCGFVVGNGLNLDCLKDDSFDFIYNYISFQHFPHPDMIYSNLKDAYRILRAGGIVKFHHNRLKEQKEGDIGFGCSFDECHISNLCKETGFRLVASHKDEFYESYHRGWWTILAK